MEVTLHVVTAPDAWRYLQGQRVTVLDARPRLWTSTVDVVIEGGESLSLPIRGGILTELGLIRGAAVLGRRAIGIWAIGDVNEAYREFIDPRRKAESDEWYARWGELLDF